MEAIKEKIRTIPNFPKTGIMFRDVTTLLKDPVGLKLVMENLISRYKDQNIDSIVGIESRGFILGGALSYALGKGFIPVRKPGKLPAEVVKEAYDLEYGTDEVEVHVDAINEGDNVLIVDDLIATGGTCEATIKLIEKLGGKVVECAVIVELPDLGGKERLAGHDVYSIVQFEGE